MKPEICTSLELPRKTGTGVLTFPSITDGLVRLSELDVLTTTEWPSCETARYGEQLTLSNLAPEPALPEDLAGPDEDRMEDPVAIPVPRGVSRRTPYLPSQRLLLSSALELELNV